MAFKTIIEPFRIHSTQAITHSTPEERDAALIRAGYNLFGLHGDEVLIDLLTRQGHEVAACADGRDGLARFREEPFDLVITDLGMPGLSGWEVARLIKEQRPGTPVTLVTGWSDQIDAEEAKERGVDFLVAKPFRSDDVLAVLRRASARD